MLQLYLKEMACIEITIQYILSPHINTWNVRI